MDSVLEEVDKMSSYVDQLMMIAKSDSPDTSLIEKDIVDLHVLLGLIVQKFLSSAFERKQSLTFESIPGNLVWANSLQLERAVVNIISNALKYTPIGGEVVISIKRQQRKIIVEVKDNGYGMRKEDLNHIFERFYKAEHSRREGTGFGLGLSIAKQFIEINEGRISLQSEFGRGTLVSIAFPAYDPKRAVS